MCLLSVWAPLLSMLQERRHGESEPYMIFLKIHFTSAFTFTFRNMTSSRCTWHILVLFSYTIHSLAITTHDLFSNQHAFLLQIPNSRSHTLKTQRTVRALWRYRHTRSAHESFNMRWGLQPSTLNRATRFVLHSLGIAFFCSALASRSRNDGVVLQAHFKDWPINLVYYALACTTCTYYSNMLYAACCRPPVMGDQVHTASHTVTGAFPRISACFAVDCNRMQLHMS